MDAIGNLVTVCQIVLATQVPTCTEPLPLVEAQMYVAEINARGSTTRVRSRQGLSRDELGPPFIVRDDHQHDRPPVVIVVPGW